jgi:hypothetical protein
MRSLAFEMSAVAARPTSSALTKVKTTRRVPAVTLESVAV